MKRYIYNITLAVGKGARCISLERVYDPLRHFRVRFGEEAVISVTESIDARNPVPSHELPTSAEEADGLPITTTRKAA